MLDKETVWGGSVWGGGRPAALFHKEWGEKRARLEVEKEMKK